MKQSVLSVFLSLFCALAAGQSQRLFTSMTELNDRNWQTIMSGQDPIWLIVFYVPWDPYAKEFQPRMQAAAADMAKRGYNVRFGAVDVSTNPQIGAKYQIEESPTVKFFSFNNGRWSVKDFATEGETESVYDFCTAQYRLTNVPYSDLGKDYVDGEIVYLTDANFDHIIKGSNEIWMLMFAAPWCYHCNLARPDWIAAAEEMGGHVRFAIIDADANRGVAKRFQVSGLPTLKFYTAGYGKDETNVQTYNGGRSQRDFVRFAQGLYDEYVENPSQYAWTHESEIAKSYEVEVSDTQEHQSALPAEIGVLCEDGSLCVVAFLPDTIYRKN